MCDLDWSAANKKKNKNSTLLVEIFLILPVTLASVLEGKIEKMLVKLSFNFVLILLVFSFFLLRISEY